MGVDGVIEKIGSGRNCEGGTFAKVGTIEITDEIRGGSGGKR